MNESFGQKLKLSLILIIILILILILINHYHRHQHHMDTINNQFMINLVVLLLLFNLWYNHQVVFFSTNLKPSGCPKHVTWVCLQDLCHKCLSQSAGPHINPELAHRSTVNGLLESIRQAFSIPALLGVTRVEITIISGVFLNHQKLASHIHKSTTTNLDVSICSSTFTII